MKAAPVFHLIKQPSPIPPAAPTVNMGILKFDVGWATDSAGEYKKAANDQARKKSICSRGGTTVSVIIDCTPEARGNWKLVDVQGHKIKRENVFFAADFKKERRIRRAIFQRLEQHRAWLEESLASHDSKMTSWREERMTWEALLITNLLARHVDGLTWKDPEAIESLLALRNRESTKREKHRVCMQKLLDEPREPDTPTTHPTIERPSSSDGQSTEDSDFVLE